MRKRKFEGTRGGGGAQRRGDPGCCARGVRRGSEGSDLCGGQAGGVGIGALYRRYGSKRGLLRRLSADGLRVYIAAVEDALADEGDPWEAFGGFMRRIVDADTHSLTCVWPAPSHPRRSCTATAQGAGVERARGGGRHPADVEVDDIALLFEQLAAVRMGEAERTRQLRRRYLTLLLDALRVPVPVCGPPQREEIQRRWSTNPLPGIRYRRFLVAWVRICGPCTLESVSPLSRRPPGGTLASRHPSYQVEGVNGTARVSVDLDLPSRLAAPRRLLGAPARGGRSRVRQRTGPPFRPDRALRWYGCFCFFRKQRSGASARSGARRPGSLTSSSSVPADPGLRQRPPHGQLVVRLRQDGRGRRLRGGQGRHHRARPLRPRSVRQVPHPRPRRDGRDRRPPPERIEPGKDDGPGATRKEGPLRELEGPQDARRARG